MKYRLVVILGLLLASPFFMMAGRQSSSPDKEDGKPPLVESGYVRKIDAKKKILTVEGNISSLPEELPGQSPEGRGGRGGGGSRPGGGGRGGRDFGEVSYSNLIREFKVYVSAETVIQDDKATLKFEDINLNDYVMVVGIQKGKSANMDASSIAVSDR